MRLWYIWRIGQLIGRKFDRHKLSYGAGKDTKEAIHSNLWCLESRTDTSGSSHEQIPISWCIDVHRASKHHCLTTQSSSQEWGAQHLVSRIPSLHTNLLRADLRRLSSCMVITASIFYDSIPSHTTPLIPLFSRQFYGSFQFSCDGAILESASFFFAIVPMWIPRYPPGRYQCVPGVDTAQYKVAVSVDRGPIAVDSPRIHVKTSRPTWLRSIYRSKMKPSSGHRAITPLLWPTG